MNFSGHLGASEARFDVDGYVVHVGVRHATAEPKLFGMGSAVFAENYAEHCTVVDVMATPRAFHCGEYCPHFVYDVDTGFSFSVRDGFFEDFQIRVMAGAILPLQELCVARLESGHG